MRSRPLRRQLAWFDVLPLSTAELPSWTPSHVMTQADLTVHDRKWIFGCGVRQLCHHLRLQVRSSRQAAFQLTATPATSAPAVCSCTSTSAPADQLGRVTPIV